MIGGKRRAEKLGSERRIEIAKKAAAATRRSRNSLIVGAYMGGVIILTVPAMLFLIDRNVTPPLAILLGYGLANIAVLAFTIPVRIYLAIRESRKKLDSN